MFNLTGRGYAKEIQLTLDPSHDCLCTKAIVEYVELTFRHYPYLMAFWYCSDSSLQGRVFYTFTKSHAGG